jgi:4-hydroxy-3-methylbut-2-en-1-yl diphosphate reductase
MKLTLIRPRGFCAGVVRAIDTVEKALEKFGAPIYVKHEIVHNRHVVDDLKEKGAIFIEDLKDVPTNSHLIYSAHGVSPQIREMAKERELIEIDATCPLVTKIHSAVKRFAKHGFKIILIGKKEHVEVIGIKDEASDVTTIISNVDDVKDLTFSSDEKLFYVTQTTLSLDDIEEIANALKDKFPNIESLPSSSICYATQNRQNALKSIVNDVDLVLVIGDPKSSNSKRLLEIAKNSKKTAFLVNDADEIKDTWFENVFDIALTAGASTPENIVQKCVEKLQKYGVSKIDEKIFFEEYVKFSLPKEVV